MKLLKYIFVLLFVSTAVFMSGCTASFCSKTDELNIKKELVEQVEKDARAGTTKINKDSFNGLSEESVAKFKEIILKVEDDQKTIAYFNELEENPKKIGIEFYNEVKVRYASVSACIAIGDNTYEPGTGALIENKDWSYAFSRGLIEGLLVYPIAWIMIQLTYFFGTNGYGQVIAIILTTILSRVLTLLLTRKSTIQAQKMQELQPELARIQAKYKGLTDAASKNALSNEMMKLYSKNKINPIATLIGPFAMMPLFIAVWGAVNGTAILRADSVFGLNLSSPLSSGIMTFNPVSIILLILLAAFQFISMKLPQWQNAKKNNRLNAKEKSTMSTTNTMTYVFTVMIIFMGWSLPIAMTIYWIASSAVTIGQTIFIKKLLHREKKFVKEVR